MYDGTTIPLESRLCCWALINLTFAPLPMSQINSRPTIRKKNNNNVLYLFFQTNVLLSYIYYYYIKFPFSFLSFLWIIVSWFRWKLRSHGRRDARGTRLVLGPVGNDPDAPICQWHGFQQGEWRELSFSSCCRVHHSLSFDIATLTRENEGEHSYSHNRNYSFLFWNKSCIPRTKCNRKL